MTCEALWPATTLISSSLHKGHTTSCLAVNTGIRQNLRGAELSSIDDISRILSGIKCSASSFSSFLLSSSFCSPTQRSFSCSALSSAFSFNPSLYVPSSLIWYLTFPSISPCIMSYEPWLCGDAHHVWYQWPSLQPVTVNPQGELPSSLLRSPSTGQCVVCVITEGGEHEMASSPSAVLFTWLLNSHQVFILTTSGKM